MKTETTLRKVARKAMRLLKSWGVNKPIFVTKRRPDIPTFWGYDWWWEPDFVFRLGDDEVGAYCGRAKTIRAYCGMFIDWPIGKNCCYTEKGFEPLNFPIHFFIALNAFVAHTTDHLGEYGHLWLSASPNSVLVGYKNKTSSLLVTIYNYRKAKVEAGGRVLMVGTLRQIMNYLAKVIIIGSL